MPIPARMHAALLLALILAIMLLCALPPIHGAQGLA